ncbi:MULTISPECIES: methylenetetrahydrofolate reductase [NAD(P)H] [Crateriforma]|uniref:Methylenetetrahydrofolate reductase n=1 Tax=Crateriforma conspicua TaxID=2527996 RepID=A0A5C6FR22_9PLAN|nr:MULTISPECIES: methylenetetrahydrofolate reductase [NAD(P)H] [Crateriforma]TWU65527.1 5,10-methylenetetrahydrofolate reductase [Crateriforma conspicua]
MKLTSAYQSADCTISFELFPPKTSAGLDKLCQNVDRLTDFGPKFMTCTYGAGGSSQGMTLDVLRQVKSRTNLPVASHLTCVGATVPQLCDFLQQATDAGVDYIVALRGDPPKGSEKFVQTEGGLRYANELVELIRERFDHFGILVAGYPEVHQEAPDAQTDLTNLKRKVDAGADVVVTQLFYDNADFYRFRDDCDRAGITVPIVPGILPVTNFAQAKRIATMCKSAIPASLEDAFGKCQNADEEFEIGVEHARRQTIDLMENGVPGIHYYVLNKTEAAERLLQGLSFAV